MPACCLAVWCFPATVAAKLLLASMVQILFCCRHKPTRCVPSSDASVTATVQMTFPVYLNFLGRWWPTVFTYFTQCYNVLKPQTIGDESYKITDLADISSYWSQESNLGRRSTILIIRCWLEHVKSWNASLSLHYISNQLLIVWVHNQQCYLYHFLFWSAVLLWTSMFWREV